MEETNLDWELLSVDTSFLPSPVPFGSEQCTYTFSLLHGMEKLFYVEIVDFLKYCSAVVLVHNCPRNNDNIDIVSLV